MAAASAPPNPAATPTRRHTGQYRRSLAYLCWQAADGNPEAALSLAISAVQRDRTLLRPQTGRLAA